MNSNIIASRLKSCLHPWNLQVRILSAAQNGPVAQLVEHRYIAIELPYIRSTIPYFDIYCRRFDSDPDHPGGLAQLGRAEDDCHPITFYKGQEWHTSSHQVIGSNPIFPTKRRSRTTYSLRSYSKEAPKVVTISFLIAAIAQLVEQ